MEECIKSRNYVTSDEPWTWSSFVRVAIEAKLSHRKRGQAQKRRKVNVDAKVETYTTVDYTKEGGVA
jgi:hypothetical protein